MQSLGWYIRRLAAMSPAEVGWRVHSQLRDLADRLLVARRQRSGAFQGDEGVLRAAPPFRVTPVAVGEWAEGGGPLGRAGLARLRERADAIADHRLSYFDLHAVDHGHPIDWHRDHKSGVAAPRRFSGSIDYRDHRVTGDCKFVWEPNRHQHLVVLARAYRATGERRYADAVVEQLGSWLAQNPYGTGMNWRSPLELGVRLINWVWALDMIREADALPAPLAGDLVRAVSMHVWEIARKYSRGSSANNHLVGEAAGVYVATSYFRGLPDAPRRRDEARDILHAQIAAQTSADGGGREQAVGYQLFVMQFFTIAGLVGRWSGDEFAGPYWRRIEQMSRFVQALGAAGPIPMFGDYDDGYVLDLGSGPGEFDAWLDVAAALRRDATLRRAREAWSEPCAWLFPADELATLGADRGAERPLHSVALADAGLYLLQRGSGAERVSVGIDCGELGLGPLAAHGHADALAITLRAFGREILTDTGTYDYFTYPRWREYFRSTAAHNTVEVDGLSQSEMVGPFLWGKRANARVLQWSPRDDGGEFAGEHDGYRRLPDPVSHRRSVSMNAEGIEVWDVLEAVGTHEAVLRLHFAPECQVTLSGRTCRAVVPEGIVTIDLDPAAAWQAVREAAEPIGGWVSRGYHQKQAATTLIGRVRWSGRAALSCRIRPQLVSRTEGTSDRAQLRDVPRSASGPGEPASVKPLLR